MKTSSLTLLIAVVFATCIGALAVTTWWAHQSQQQVVRANKSLEDCRQLAEQIIAIRKSPETAADNQASKDDLAKRFEAWSRGVGLEATQVERIDPLSPRRIGDTDYVLEGTDIELTGVTLPQLAELASAIAREDRRLRVSRLRLSSPRSTTSDAPQTEPWRAELALTYLRHSPKSSRQR